MKLLFTFLLASCSIFLSNGQEVQNNYQSEFADAYSEYPEVPRGMLEAVAFVQTRFRHITTNEIEGCSGIPLVHGVMGLTDNGKGYFRSNLTLVSQLSGYSKTQIKENPAINIKSYASAYVYLLDSLNVNPAQIERHDIVLKSLSEIPWDHNVGNSYALNAFVYEVFKFMNSNPKQVFYNFPNYELDLIEVFGENNLQVLSSSFVSVTDSGVHNEDNILFVPQETRTAEYAPALWVAAPTCNYSSRNGTAISAVTIHTIQGSYSGAISWAQNCSANVSYHYVERSSDGQVTQMLLEADKGWHVGAENPYTIGIEHEGYVSDAAWYTEAMYQSSADLVRDITQSGYGINPLRTYYGASSSGVNVLGGCTKIKGHQHFPNNTHTDPGINWDWPKYYKLINNSPNVTSYTTATGTIYDSGGAGGNYDDDERLLYLIEPTGATSITLSFNQFNIEANWDYMFIYDGENTDANLIGTYTGTTIPSTITSSGGKILIEFRSDCATTDAGWEINWTSVIDAIAGDNTSPITQIEPLSNWYTDNFNVDFQDEDEVDGSGIQYALYQVLDNDGTYWLSNANHGFFNDDFDQIIQPEWTQQTATWSISNGYLQCTDETESNTNIYASLNQDDQDVFLYNWSGKINGSGTNRRAGLHFMCSNPTLNQRGNSYMVYFRADNNKIQIYESVNNSISLEADIDFQVQEDQWYDFKIVYDKTTGEIKVFVDNVLSGTWTDSTPITTGNAISLRSGNCIYQINNFSVMHNRSETELVTVSGSNELRFQNVNSTSPAGQIKSIAIDSAGNISSTAIKNVNIDWTIPSTVAVVNDGNGADIDAFTNNNTVNANWTTSTDTHSDVESYWYAIGTTIGGTDVVNWTNNWFNTSVSHSGLSLTYGETYYVSVKAKNGAGLFSAVTTSDGNVLNSPTNPPVANFTIPNLTVCEIDSIQIENNSLDAQTYAWTVSGGGNTLTSTEVNPYFTFQSSGSYEVTLEVTGPGGTDTQVEIVQINVVDQPVSDFTIIDDILSINNPQANFTNSSVNANGYYWDFGDNTNSTDENPWHIYTSIGEYQVKLAAINGTCPNDTITKTIFVVDDLSIINTENEEAKLYPNPTENKTNLILPNGSFDVTVSSINGQIVYEFTGVQNQLEIDLTSCNSGVFLVKIIGKDTIVFKEIVKY